MANRYEPRVEFKATLELSEVEARALAQLFGYGVDKFLNTFYQLLGRHYLEPHEAGIRKLAETIAREIGPQLQAVDVAREAIRDRLRERCPDCLADERRHYSTCPKAKVG